MNYFLKISLAIITVFILNFNCYSQVHDRSWREIVNKKEGVWFASEEAKQIAENVLLYQRNIGGWPKNIQMQNPLSKAEKKKLMALKNDMHDVTTDNGATYQEMIYLSKMYRQVPDERYKNAFLLGLNYLLEAQYENGGWPQFYPLQKGYYSHITFNDDSMVHILKVLEEIKNKTNYFSIYPSEETVEKATLAFNKGIECILKTQYIQNGVLTGWCAQYDEKTLEPAKARAYELPSLSGAESANIVLLLMTIENPSPAIINAVNSACIWFEKVKITGIRQELVFNDKGKIIHKKVVPDVDAPPIWARFMELNDNTPFFCDRDGIKKYSLSEIGDERRNGYGWYTYQPEEVLKKYETWKLNYAENIIQNKKELPKPANEYEIIVAKDNSGDYKSIQDAIYASKSFPYQRVIIKIKKGIYNEKVRVPEWNSHISLIGESKEETIITYNDYFDKINLGRNSTFYTPTLLVEGNNFYAANLTIENTAGEVGQAIALSVVANEVFINNCNILGNQDTLYTSGENNKQYFKNCYIEGTTDFIFGNATVLFENCLIHSKSNSYITAASTPKDVEFGYVFKNCKLTSNEKATKVYLGRPWRIYAKTVFINCELGNHIVPEGWHNWNKQEAQNTVFYAEYNSYGKGADTKNRVSWSHQLTKEQAEQYLIENILGNNNWYINY